MKGCIRCQDLEDLTGGLEQSNLAQSVHKGRSSGVGRLIATMAIQDKIVEQDHRGVKQVRRPMLGFKSFEAAQDTLVGIELMHMIKKRQLVLERGDEGLTAAEQFYALAS
jgi:hypothetical protein